MGVTRAFFHWTGNDFVCKDKLNIVAIAGRISGKDSFNSLNIILSAPELDVVAMLFKAASISDYEMGLKGKFNWTKRFTSGWLLEVVNDLRMLLTLLMKCSLIISADAFALAADVDGQGRLVRLLVEESSDTFRCFHNVGDGFLRSSNTNCRLALRTAILRALRLCLYCNRLSLDLLLRR